MTENMIAIIKGIENSAEYQAEIGFSRARAAQTRGRCPKAINKNVVEFYGSRLDSSDAYGKWLTNCALAPIVIDNVLYNSSEHYYQMQKFTLADDDPALKAFFSKNPKVSRQIYHNLLLRMKTATPVEVARIGQQTRSVPIRSDWEDVKRAVMTRAVLTKYQSIPAFKQKLQETGTAVLIERAPVDSYWAINNRGLGENALGLLLMAVREVI